MRAVLVLAMLLLGGCELITGPDQPARLEDARALWARVGPRDYSFEYTPNCFCVLGGQRVLVIVDNDAVVSARHVGTNDAVDAALLRSIPTVPELFDIIQDAIASRAYRVEATYDAHYGYPVHAGIDYDANAIDDEFGFTVTAFASLELLGAGR